MVSVVTHFVKLRHFEIYDVYKCVKFDQLNALRKIFSVKGVKIHIGRF